MGLAIEMSSGRKDSPARKDLHELRATGSFLSGRAGAIAIGLEDTMEDPVLRSIDGGLRPVESGSVVVVEGPDVGQDRRSETPMDDGGKQASALFFMSMGTPVGPVGVGSGIGEPHPVPQFEEGQRLAERIPNLASLGSPDLDVKDLPDVMEEAEIHDEPSRIGVV
jgi:hypothetical protein